ncbi:MAG TPA: hypothetical protein VK959_00835 [Methylophilaceae bacterium]|nr:hypothetical protein [Methylophilaceae bacterium]
MLHSDWLLKMLDKTGYTPRERVLALFDILQDWATAPGLKTGTGMTGSENALIAYLARQLTALRLPEAEILAAQIYFIALGALHTAGTGECDNAFLQGRQAAAVLLDAHRPPRRVNTGAAVVASLFVLVSAVFIAAGDYPVAPSQPMATRSMPTDIGAFRPVTARLGSSPDQVASLNDSLERMRRGVCQYPQALMLAPEARAVFLENVVNGSVPTDAGQIREARLLAQKVECYYAPVAMTAL